MSICLMIMIFWGTLFSPTGFRVGLIPVYFKGNVEAISVMLILLIWFFYYYYFDRNQILLCKYFDGKSLAISHNTMNSTGFLKLSKFHHLESVSKGNMYTFFSGFIMFGSSLVVSLCPLWFLLFPQMIKHYYNFGYSPFECPGCLLHPVDSDLEGYREMGEEEGHLLRSIISDPCQNLWPPSLKMAFISHFPIPGQLVRAVIFIASRLPLFFPDCIYWCTCAKHRNRRSSDATADPGPLEMFSTGSFYYLYNLTSLLPKANQPWNSWFSHMKLNTSHSLFFSPVVVFHTEFWWALRICALVWSKVNKITTRSQKY